MKTPILQTLIVLLLTLSFQVNSFAQCPQPGIPETGDFCQEAPFMCLGLEDFCDTLGLINIIGEFPGCPMNVLNNDEWFAFVAGSTNIAIQITPSACQDLNGTPGMQGAIYEGYCDGPAIATQCNCTTDIFVLASDSFNVGQTYYIVLDGCAGNICAYDLVLTEGNTTPVSPPPAAGISGSDLACPGGTAEYSVTNPGAAGFTWTIDPPGIGSFMGGNEGNSVSILWDTIGTSSVCVTSSNGCFSNPEVVCFTVNINDIPPVTKEYPLCLGECVECAEQLFCEPGTYQVTLSSYLGCDSSVTCIIGPVVPPTLTCVGQVTLCAPEAFTICNTAYTASGIYCLTCDNWLGCDSTVCVDLAIADPMAVIAPPDPLPCNGTILLDGSQSSYFLVADGITKFKWTGPPGGIFGSDNGPMVSVGIPGEYTLILTHSRTNVACSATATVIVVQAEDIDLGPDREVCLGENLTLDAGTGFASYNWSTGDTTQTIVVTTGGVYAVAVTSSGGCSATDTVSISFNAAPTVELGPDTMICIENLPLQLDAGPGFSAYLWSTGDTTQTTVVTAGGAYSVTVANADGCTDSDTVSVSFNAAPIVELGPDTMICFQNLPHLLDAGPGFSSYLWNTGNTTQTLLITDSTVVNFSVTVFDANGCTASDSVMVEVSVCSPINEPVLPGELTVVPNPTSGDVTFYFNGFVPGEYQISFSDVSSRSLKVEKVYLSTPVQSVQMNLSYLISGNYLVKVASEKGVMVKRLIVQR